MAKRKGVLFRLPCPRWSWCLVVALSGVQIVLILRGHGLLNLDQPIEGDSFASVAEAFGAAYAESFKMGPGAQTPKEGSAKAPAPTEPAVPEQERPAAEAEKEAHCKLVHPNADSPEMLHVVYAADTAQLDGVKASVASLVLSTASPDYVTVHILVQEKMVPEFKDRFNLKPECDGAVTESGVLIKMHSVSAGLIAKSVAKVPAKIRQERGRIDSLENFARFYMHLVFENVIVIYLDADTIVQSDLGELRRKLRDSGKTVGFVDRGGIVPMSRFIRKPKVTKECQYPSDELWKKMLKRPAYNVGIIAINLKRWKERGVAERVEEWVALHNACNGEFWIGGSQPPLLLAFQNRKDGEQKDFVVYDKTWNTLELGWAAGMDTASLKKKAVLHWNGHRKPWQENGLYKDIWQPYFNKFKSLLKPYKSDDDDAETAGSLNLKNKTDLSAQLPAAAQTPGSDDSERSPAPAPKKTLATDVKKATTTVTMTTTTLSLEELAAMRDCPNVRLTVPHAFEKDLKEYRAEAEKQAAKKKKKLKDKEPYKPAECKLGTTFGCSDDKQSMWTTAKCRGIFNVSGSQTVCGSELAKEPRSSSKRETCVPGAGGKQGTRGTCNLMLLTSFFTTIRDWQRGKMAQATFDKIKWLYQSTLMLGLNVTVVYDVLPPEVVDGYSHEGFRFVQVDKSAYSKINYGVNDIRYFFFDRLVRDNPEWQAIFVLDAFDIRVKLNPCPDLKEGELYLQIEREKLRKHPWMSARFRKLGGKYMEWYNTAVDGSMWILNCGIMGGRRKVMETMLTGMVEVLNDPNLVAVTKHEDLNANMAILNYVAYRKFPGRIRGNEPVHSKYKKFQKWRTDVWFVHK